MDKLEGELQEGGHIHLKGSLQLQQGNQYPPPRILSSSFCSFSCEQPWSENIKLEILKANDL